MKVYVTRHGQVATDAEYYGDVNYPRGDMPLSPLGREQAKLLGERLKKEGFNGRIFASPFIRTMETAELISEITGSEIYPTPAFHEIIRSDEGARSLQGSDLDRLKALFPNVSKNASLVFPWWASKAENNEDVRYRVAHGMNEIMNSFDEDFLVVGHGASVSAVLTFLLGVPFVSPVYNCSYSCFDTYTKKSVINSATHLPYKKITYNSTFFENKPFNVEIPEKLSDEQGIKILHIGDTPSRSFPWYRSLIKAVNPDVIIHTGDTVDEVKVGRIPEVREEYIDRLSVMLEILSESDAKVYWTAGNNDLADKVSELAPKIEIVPADTVLNIGGKRICVAHIKACFTKDADIYLYGHSTRYELWSMERNTPERDTWYLDAMWADSVIVLPQRKLYTIARAYENNK